MMALVDTNVLVYQFDPRFPEKQKTARTLLRHGLEESSLCLPHQAIVEFIAATTRPIRPNREPLLSSTDAYQEAEELLMQYLVLYPDETVIRTAFRGAATYQLSWYDAHLWAYAESYGCETLYSEDFQHERSYGAVRVINPFIMC